ncbi:LOW QUALITY PROTEIN: mas-related G-protein coupled receptor member H-like [Serinus canaria]|uniref:LOW QUALITY PROTEIN: mas-related G-protein coupled receptor member H-like n=1 Tax=Serinus canaria TaxID=9135 RepID=UPI0021CCF8C7|nr:LOW QUALITY PROTEIN: mas-related G-protein coupled receptor member H-like [Serinus canaria]
MEVTKVSPPPTSPTEGDDLCETDVTDVAIHSVTLLIGLCGLAGNRAVIGLLSLKTPNAGIFVLAVIDFLFLLFAVPSAFLILVEDVSCSPIMPMLYLRFLFQLSVVSYYWALLWLMRSSNVQFMDKLCCNWQLPLRLLWVVDSSQSWAFFALFAVIPAVTFLCSSHKQKHCQAALISMYALILLLLVVPVVISSTVDFINAKRGSQQQQPKRRDIVTLFTVLLTLLFSLWNFLQQLGYTAVSSQALFLLVCIHSSIKPFIYLLVGMSTSPCSMGSLQLSLQRVFEEPKEKTDHSDNAPTDTAV